MENLYKYINSEFICEKLNKIDNEIILESLNCKVLKEVAAQLYKSYKKEKSDLDEKIRQYEVDGRTFWGDKKIYSKKFSQVFADYYNVVQWDKISESDIEVIDASSWENFERENSANIRKVINTKKKAILITQDPETKIYEYVIFYGGQMIQLKEDKEYKKPGSIAQIYKNRDWHDLNQREKIDFCKGKTLYFIDMDGKHEEYQDLKTKRKEEKEGMIYLDPYSLQIMAENNRKRYEKIISKQKALNLNNDALLDECHKVINKIVELSNMIAKDPITNADLIAPVQYLMPYVCDKRRWVNTTKYNGEYRGVNGLLPLIVEYTEAIKYISNEGSKYYLDRIETIKKSIKSALDTINKTASKYNITF